MKDTKHKILTLAALTTIAAGVIHLTNRVIVASSQLKEMLDFSNHTIIIGVSEKFIIPRREKALLFFLFMIQCLEPVDTNGLVLRISLLKSTPYIP